MGGLSLDNAEKLNSIAKSVEMDGMVSSGVAACCGQVTLLLFSSLLPCRVSQYIGINVLLHNMQYTLHICFVTKTCRSVSLFLALILYRAFHLRLTG